jgi:hypothetical protein
VAGRWLSTASLRQCLPDRVSLAGMAAITRRQKVADKCWGLEVDWLAVDEDGHVSLMSTAGRGPIPARVLDRLTAVNRSLSAINDVPLRGEAEWLLSTRDVFDVWVPWLRRGLFAFDWAVNDYSIIGRPHNPAMIDEIPVATVAELARLASFTVSFEQAKDLQLTDAAVEWYWPRHPADRS